MRNLQFLSIYNSRWDTNVRVYLPEDSNFPPRLKLLHWEEYPGTCLPHSLRLEFLVELNLEKNKLRHLWKGTQSLGNLKKLMLAWSYNLEELPDLANATNLEILDVTECESLVEIHFSVGNLHKLERLEMRLCTNLQVVPSLFNLSSLETVGMMGCCQMRKLPDIFTTITSISITDTMLVEFTESIRLWSRLKSLFILGSIIPRDFLTQPHVVKLMVERSGADIERIPDCIKDLHRLETLMIVGCSKLVSLPELPKSLTSLFVWNCESLETLVPFPSDSRIEYLSFLDCLKLDPGARRAILQQSRRACVPGRDIPAKFNHRAIGNSLTITSNACGFKMCFIVSPKSEMEYGNCIELVCRISINGCPKGNCIFPLLFRVHSEHLVIFYCDIPQEDDDEVEQSHQILFEFSSSSQEMEFIECGVQILRDIFDYGLFAKQHLVKFMLEDYGPLDESLAAAMADTTVDFSNGPECYAVYKRMIDDFYGSFGDDSKELLENDDVCLSDESFLLDASRVETDDDLDGRLEYDASRVKTDDSLFAPAFFSFGF
ncbi:unnamed protein product [Eruca vesicaria subsp. sativa]|uniref:Uncharacterized protein n=1 Tax=Eruca vesicaria subsp. sativa TaxID=29727 RepID=A0ABC8MAC5_ERUVS|nr:unnamed protein product [Eruca vesicaria subsp. sativa]